MTPQPPPWPGYDYDPRTRTFAACQQIGEILADGDWHAWADIVAPVAASHDLQNQSVSTLLYNMVKPGSVERGGEYDHRFRCDHRMVRLAGLR